MSIEFAAKGLSRSALIEAIYRASRIVSRTPYDFDHAQTTSLNDKERARVSAVVADIVTEIEAATEFEIGALPAHKQSEILTNLYKHLSDHISTGRARDLDTEELLSDLHAKG